MVLGPTNANGKDVEMVMIKQALASILLVVALAMPATAQQSEEGPMSAAQCQALFQEADANGDGVLSQQEIAAAEMEGFEAGTGLSAFMAECQG
jgi:hypothetical protein